MSEFFLGSAGLTARTIIHVVGVRPPSSSPLFSEVSIKGMREGGLDFESCRLGQIKVTAHRGLSYYWECDLGKLSVLQQCHADKKWVE